MSGEDRRVVACNYREPTKEASQGALAFVSLSNSGGGHDRIQVLVRSRGGRLIVKWENIKRLHSFRPKTLPPEHPRYSDERLMTPDDPAVLAAELTAACARLRGIA